MDYKMEQAKLIMGSTILALCIIILSCVWPVEHIKTHQGVEMKITTGEEIRACPKDNDSWYMLPDGRRIRLDDGALIAENVRIGNGVIICDGVVIGNGCRVGAYATLGINVILADDVTIGPDCMLFDGVQVGNRCTVGKGSIIGDNITIASGIRIAKRSRIIE